MTFRAVYRDGAVVLPTDAEIPDGSRLDIRVVREKRSSKSVRAKGSARAGSKTKSKPKKKTLNDRLRSVIGKAKGLPRDFAAQHDHYIHGTPKR